MKNVLHVSSFHHLKLCVWGRLPGRPWEATASLHTRPWKLLGDRGRKKAGGISIKNDRRGRIRFDPLSEKR